MHDDVDLSKNVFVGCEDEPVRPRMYCHLPIRVDKCFGGNALTHNVDARPKAKTCDHKLEFCQPLP